MNKYIVKISSKLSDGLKGFVRSKVQAQRVANGSSSMQRNMSKKLEMYDRAQAYGHKKIPAKHGVHEPLGIKSKDKARAGAILNRIISRPTD